MPTDHRGNPTGDNHLNTYNMTKEQYDFRQNTQRIANHFQHLKDTGQEDELRRIGSILDRSTTATSLHRQADRYTVKSIRPEGVGWDKQRFTVGNEMGSKVSANDPYQHINLSNDAEYLHPDYRTNND